MTTPCKLILNGSDGCLFFDAQRDVPPTAEYPYSYDTRHGDLDWSRPITIEPPQSVAVNFCGTLLAKKQLELIEWAPGGHALNVMSWDWGG